MLALISALVLGQPPDPSLDTVTPARRVESGRFEFALYPAAVQLNGKFTQHVGAALGLTWHPNDSFGVTALALWNYLNEESSFSKELGEKTRHEAVAASTLLLLGGAAIGFELTPLHGDVMFGAGRPVRFTAVLNGAMGAGATRHQLKPANDLGPATYGFTGWRLIAEIGGGVRVRFAEHFSARVELRNIMYSAAVSQVNGCVLSDLETPECPSVAPFDVPSARVLLQYRSSDVLNNLGLYLGASLDI